ncbi:hypothetical protein MPSEU_000485500 [Mayamaea pseudoterrestris]|nr:hypothetical protein MPSEU_000485500 [Mayamaea pseudoterrestris]
MSSRNLPGFLRRSRRFDDDEEDDDDVDDDTHGVQIGLDDRGRGQVASSDLTSQGTSATECTTIQHQNGREVSQQPSKDSLLSTDESTFIQQQDTLSANGSQGNKRSTRQLVRQSSTPENLTLSDSWQEIHHQDSDLHSSGTKDLAETQLSFRDQQFEKVLVQPDIVNMEELRSLSWNGIPTTYRATAWKILLGYLPTNKQRRKATLERKRNEYRDAMAQHYDIDDNSRTLQEQETLRQVIVDVPRTCPDVPLFRNERIKRILTRILYIFAMRHPASSYVQGINDIASPFMTVFLADYYDGQDVLDGSVMHHLSEERLDELEADVYWCLTNLLANIQDHYTSDQPGVQRMVGRLEELVNRIDVPLCDHLREQGIEFLQFSFKWMNCLLLREFSLDRVPRLWDTYISETNGFEDFHVYVCAAYVCQFSAQLQEMAFDELFGFFQSLQTGDWKEREIEMLLSQAYVLSTLFRGSDAHLSSNR